MYVHELELALCLTPNCLFDLDLPVILGWKILILAHLAHH